MARRKSLQGTKGAFDRAPDEWRALGAPAFVYDIDAAAEAYSVWGMSCWGGQKDPSDQGTRFYYIGLIWLPCCVKPRYLYHVGAVTDVERALLTTGHARWDPPDRCRSHLLRPDAGVPEWLELCRSSGRPRG